MAKVMIVDDDATTVSLLGTLLELDGFQVMVVSQGKQVVGMAEKNPPDVILMDYNLADMTGADVIRLIRSHARLAHIPIVVASGMNVEAEVKAAGANHFVGKPFDPSKLSAALKQFAN